MLYPIIRGVCLFSAIFCAALVPELKAQGTVRVMPLGDSITYGMGAGQAKIPGGYRDPLAQLYAAGTTPFLFVGSDSGNTTPYLVSTSQQNNEGHTGFRIDQIQTNLNAWQSSANPDVVLLHLGTNDILHNFNLGTGVGNDTSTAVARLSTLISTLYTNNPSLKIVLSTLIPIQDARDLYVKNFNAALASTVVPNFTGQGRRIVLVDNYANFVLPDSNWDTSKFADYAHPNATGYSAMANTWATFPLPMVEGIVFTPTTANGSAGLDSSVAVNLVRNGQSTLGSVSAPIGSISGTFPVSGLNDGSAAGNSNFTYYSVTNTANGATTMPDTVTFELNTIVNTSGYDITSVQAISGWGDHNLGAQRFQLLLSTNHEEYVNYGTYTNAAYVNGGNSSFRSTVSHSTGTLARNITGVRYIFMNPDTSNGATSTGATQVVSSGGTVIHELQVFGTASAILPPSPYLFTAQSSATSTGKDSAIAVNLLRAGQSTLTGVTAPNVALPANFTIAGLNDGSAATSSKLSYYSVTDTANGAQPFPATITFALNTTTNPYGYDISSIQAISGWGDHSLGAKRFQLLLAIDNGPYTDYGTYRNADVVNGGNSSYLSTVSSPSGKIASHVTGIRFVFKNPDASNGTASVGSSQVVSSGGTVIRELQAFGTPSADPSPYLSWANVTYGLTGNDALPQSDPNHNGITNLVEYALGGNPVNGSTGQTILPVSQIVANHTQLTFTRYLDRTDINLTVQASENLATWTDLAKSIAGGSFAIIEAGTTITETGPGNSRSMTIVDPVAVTNPSKPNRFLRLQVFR